MQVRLISTTEGLAALPDAWNRLAANPFCSWDWLECWWRHYQADSAARSGPLHLWTLAVFDAAGELAAVAPWCLQRSLRRGRVVRMLGGGQVCSDHLTIPCRPGCEAAVAEALAQWLLERQSPPDSCTAQDWCRWDMIELSGVDPHDLVMARLVEQLGDRGCLCQMRTDGNCWVLELPESWDMYLATLSKSHRKQLRRLQRRSFDSGQAVLHTVDSPGDLDRAWPILLALHQKRWQRRGQPGCFQSATFCKMLREAAGRMLRSGRLQFHWLEIDGRPVAADYQLAQGAAIYVYQGGVDPDELDCEPGRLLTMAAIQRAIRGGYRIYDFLRGDEPYKAHWRAVARPTVQLRIVSSGLAAQLRHAVHSTGEKTKDVVKRGLQQVGLRQE